MIDPIYNLFSIQDLILIFSIFLNLSFIFVYFEDIRPLLKNKKRKEIRQNAYENCYKPRKENTSAR